MKSSRKQRPDKVVKHLGEKFKPIENVKVGARTYAILTRMSDETGLPIGHIIDLMVQHNEDIRVQRILATREGDMDAT